MDFLKNYTGKWNNTNITGEYDRGILARWDCGGVSISSTSEEMAEEIAKLKARLAFLEHSTIPRILYAVADSLDDMFETIEDKERFIKSLGIKLGEV